MGSGSERLGGSDVGKRGCSSYRSVLSFRGPEAEQEKLESLVLIGDRIRAIREVKKLAHNRVRHRERSACRTGAPEYGAAVTIYVPGVVRKAQAYILNAGGYCQGFPE